MPTEKPHLDSFHGLQCGELLQHTSGSDGKVLSRLGEVPGTSAVLKNKWGTHNSPLIATAPYITYSSGVRVVGGCSTSAKKVF